MLIEEGGVKHYCLVKNPSRLLASQGTKGKRKEYFCLNCFNPFSCQETLNKHQEYCYEYEAVKIEMPEFLWSWFQTRHRVTPDSSDVRTVF